MKTKKRQLKSQQVEKKKKQKNNPDGTVEVNENDLEGTRNTLKDEELINIKHRTLYFNQNIKESVQAILLNIRSNNDISLQYLEQEMRNYEFPNNVERYLDFIERFTGVKVRDRGCINYSQESARSWLNRQRALAYGDTLFLDYILETERVAKMISLALEVSNTSERYFYKLSLYKLISEILGALYKPESSHSAKKKIICANSIKKEKFRNKIREFCQCDIDENTKLEDISKMLHEKYKNMLNAAHDGIHPQKRLSLKIQPSDDSSLNITSDDISPLNKVDINNSNCQHSSCEKCTTLPTYYYNHILYLQNQISQLKSYIDHQVSENNDLLSQNSKLKMQVQYYEQQCRFTNFLPISSENNFIGHSLTKTSRPKCSCNIDSNVQAYQQKQQEHVIYFEPSCIKCMSDPEVQHPVKLQGGGYKENYPSFSYNIPFCQKNNFSTS